MELPLLTAAEVAKQLNIKKFTVYELIKRSELPSSKVGKQVRVSQADINRYLESRKTGALPPESAHTDAPKPAELTGQPDAPVILCGQDRCLDLLVSRVAGARNVQVLRSYRGSYNGLYAFYNGTVSMTASHLWDGETDSYNYPYIRRLVPGVAVGALRLVGRMQGLYVKKGNPLGIKDWADCIKPHITMINRERGCGTRILLDQKLKLMGIDTAFLRGYTRECTSHLACAGAVAKGHADVACGCRQAVEDVEGIDFIPLQLEWYDLIFRRSDQNTPAIQEIFTYITSNSFAQDLALMGMYDISQTGRYEEF